VERDAKYASVAVFAVLAVAAAFAFVWWYSGRGDQRVYQRYEIYFEGSVSGLSQGSPVRYLGVDVGRVVSLRVDRDDPNRVKVVVEVDEEAPLSGATEARLGLLGLTGLLYIDLQVDPKKDPGRALVQGDRYPMIAAKKGDIQALVEKLPDLVNQASAVMVRIERLVGDENLEAVGTSLGNLREASTQLPALSRDAAALAADLRRTSSELASLTQRVHSIAADAEPGVAATLENAEAAVERLSRTAESLERIVVANEASLAGFAGPGLGEVQQLVIDVRDASGEVRELARTLREQPSSLLREPKERGVEIAP
jgi:phospholipid/cholesterol/gamma-HCH transport system substrate-binding protein